MLLTVREVAERLRVSARTVEREIAAGRLACVRVRSRRLVERTIIHRSLPQVDDLLTRSRELQAQPEPDNPAEYPGNDGRRNRCA